MRITTSHKNGKWIQKMDLKKGAFTAQAKRAKKSVSDFAKEVIKNPEKFKSTTRKRAILAKTFRKISKKK
jgi:hypothetical protein